MQRTQHFETPAAEFPFASFHVGSAELLPGQTADAEFDAWNTDTEKHEEIEDTSETIYDQIGDGGSAARSWYGENFLLPGETAICIRSADNGRFETIGSKGLIRVAKAPAFIPIGGSGTVTIWHKQLSVISVASVVAHNDWGGNDIYYTPGMKIWVKYFPDAGKWRIFPSYHLQWGVAQGQWYYTSGLGDACMFVTVQACDDCGGTNPSGTDVTVTLVRSGEQHPNVNLGETIGYVVANNQSERVCVTDYLDDKVDTIKQWDGIYNDIPPGWECMEDMRDRFPRGPEEPCPEATTGEIGGSVDHDHFAFAGPAATGITIDSGGSGTTGSNTTGISVAAHGDHYHKVTIEDVEHGVDGDNSTPANVLPEQSNDEICSSTSYSDDLCTTTTDLPHSVTDPGHTHTIPAHSHTINDPEHGHPIFLDPAEHIPPYRRMIFKIRIDNSGAP